MTQEDKELLLKDLCARLPYGVICLISGGHTVKLTNIDTKNGKGAYPYIFTFSRSAEQIKPYLRPMSSMTDEEKKEYTSYCFAQPFLQKDEVPNLGSVSMCIDWLNANHFDYRGLIEKGLAIEVTEDNNPYKD